MNYIDIIFAVPLLWGLYKGFKRGLIIELATLFSLWAGVYAGVKFSSFLSIYLKTAYHFASPYLPIVSFSILFLGVLILIYFIAKLIEGIVNAMSLGIVNKLLGAIIGMLKFALILSTLLFLLNNINKTIPFIPITLKQ